MVAMPTVACGYRTVIDHQRELEMVEEQESIATHIRGSMQNVGSITRRAIVHYRRWVFEGRDIALGMIP
jgi:hypothetical protein